MSINKGDGRASSNSYERDSVGDNPDWLSGNNNKTFVHELEISDNGDWIDNVYKASKPSSISAWFRRRRAWSPSSDRSVFTSADVLCRGYLEKLGSWRKNWKTRYFILRSDTHSLCYFNNHVEMILLGEVVISINSKSPRNPNSNLNNRDSTTTAQSTDSPQPRPSSSLNSSSSNLTFGVTCSTTAHTLIMEAPDAISLGVWLQALQEEVQAAQDNALNNSCNSLQKSSPAAAHSNTVEELLSTFAGTQIPGLECVGFQDLPVSVDSEREGEVGTIASVGKVNSSEEQDAKPRSPGKQKRGSMLTRMFNAKDVKNNENPNVRHVVGKNPPEQLGPIQKQESILEETQQTKEETNSNSDDEDEDEDLLEKDAEAKISESFSPKSHPNTPNRFDTPNSVPRSPTAASLYGATSPDSSSSPSDKTRPRNKFTANCSVGLQLNIQLSGVCDSSDSLFVVAFGGKLTPAGSHALDRYRTTLDLEKNIPSTGPKSPRSKASLAQAIDLSHVNWVQLGRTETVNQKNAGSIISRTTSKAPASGLSGLQASTALFCRLALNTIHSKNSSMAAFQEMNNDLNLRLPSEVFNAPEPVAYIGICYTTSVPLTRRVHTSSHRLSFKTPPYTHKLYGFQSLTGRVLTREELHLPRYSLSVPAALLSLLLEERLPSVEKLLKVVVSELMIATKLLHALQKEGGGRGRTGSKDKKMKKMANQQSSGQIIDIMDDQISSASKYAAEVDKAETKVKTLKSGEEILKQVRGSLLGTYLSCYNYCMDSLREEDVSFQSEKAAAKAAEVGGGVGSKKGRKESAKTPASPAVALGSGKLMGVPVHMGGARLKRSVMKKSEVLAFIPTNLNVHLLHTESVRSRVEGSKLEETPEKAATTTPQKTASNFTSLSSLMENEVAPGTPKSSKMKVIEERVGHVIEKTGHVVEKTIGVGLSVGESVGQAVNQAVSGLSSHNSNAPPPAPDSPVSPPTRKKTTPNPNANADHHLQNRSLDNYSFHPKKEAPETPEEKPQSTQSTSNIDTFSSLTFGVPSAHSMSKSGGGLRKLLLSSGTDGVFRADTDAWNVRSEGNYRKNQLQADPLKSSLEVDMSTSRAAQMCALHAKGVEMTVADLRSHAGTHGNGRRNSILKLAATTRSYGGKESGDDIADIAKEVKAEVEKNRDVLGMGEEGEEKTKLTGDVEDWLKCATLMKSFAISTTNTLAALALAFACRRVDIVTSQALSVAISAVQTTLSMAAAGSPHHVAILPNILEVGFLCSFESLLSAYGGELVMIEDLCVAVEWLSTVTIRIVERKKKDKQGLKDERDSEGGVDVKNPKGYGYADGVWIRRSRKSEDSKDGGEGESFSTKDSESTSGDIAGIKWGELIVDLEVNFATAQAIRDAKKALGREKGEKAAKSERAEARRWKKLTRRASSPLMSSSDKLNAEKHARDSLEKQFDGAMGGIGKAIEASEPRADNSKPATPKSTEWGEADVNVLATFGLTAVLFTQGINAHATLANNKMGGDAAVQISINRTSMHRLKMYFTKFREVSALYSAAWGRASQASQAVSEGKGKEDGGDKDPATQSLKSLDDLFNKAQAAVNDACNYGNEKNVNVLLKTSDVCRKLNGTHAILCKSGKDRTSMAVTLEQARYLCSRHGVVSGKKSTEIMRRHGVRRQNVWANTGQKNFAFNGINYTSLPKCFRPPAGCYSGSVNT
ncbi:hypothetical protein TL16_g10643 [Triparma laevis f. inornata]|uniref:PH domain-containing protein n=1 Tax=Triparma laevis f. inornata TaxID=1714386 RepID=A0A9W7B9G0_9STRA|nr:hypothetical protein TL16_g10643 [Triparma laevis f. inornata]